MNKSIGRNDFCSCGSGKKFKKCCGVKQLNMKPNSARVIYRRRDYLEGMIRSARLAKKALDHTAKYLSIGITTKELEIICSDYFAQHGAISATLNYHGYSAEICISINEVICHGIPGGYKLKSGDIINLDVSCILNGYYGDNSRTYEIGTVSPLARRLIKVTEEAMYKGIDQALAYSRLGNIGAAIVEHAHNNGFSVVEQFVGHGIGKNFHEDPQVPHFGKKGTGVELLPGMIFTIEPMINEGVMDSVVLDDGWTAVTADGKLSAQFEHTIVVTLEAPRILTAEEDDAPIFTPEMDSFLV